MPEDNRSRKQEVRSRRAPAPAAPDWKQEISLRLAPLKLEPTREAEIAEELAQHLQDCYRELIAGGAAEDKARSAALGELSDEDFLARGLRRVEHETPQEPVVLGGSGSHNFLSSLWQDVRYGLRQLRRNPGFTTLAVITLALGIGANTAIFSAVEAVLLKPLPFTGSARLVGIENGSYPKGAYAAMRGKVRTMNVATYSDGHQFNLTGAGEPVRLDGTLVSANFFKVLGVQAELGGTFSRGQDMAGQDSYVVLSHALWQQRFNGDPGIVGRVISLEGVPRQVTGVMPADFRFPSPSTAVWIPLGIDPADSVGSWGGDYMPVIARLKPGATLGEATAEIRLFQSRLLPMFPWPMPKMQWNVGLAVVPLSRILVGDLRGRLLILLGAVLLVLLIASANVTNLTLARASAREREMALRAALGASRSRIIRQLMTESLLMSCAGGALGVALAACALPLIQSFFPPSTPGFQSIGINGQVLLFTATLAIFSGIVAGTAPALQGAWVALTETLKAGGRSVASSANRQLRKALVAGEIALAVVLVSGAGLLIRSLWSLAHVSPGFQAEHLLTARITPNESFCSDAARCLEFYRQLTKEAGALPGVQEAAVINTIPLGGRINKRSLVLEGKSETDQGLPLVWEDIVSPQYFRVMDIPILRGRAFAPDDATGTPPVAILSAATAKLFWPGQDPIGKHIRLARTADWLTVIGVVPDVRAFTLEQPVPGWMNGTVYLPYGPKATQETKGMPAEMTLAMRAPGGPTGVAQSVRAIVHRLNAETPVGEVRTMTAIINESTAATRSITSLFGSFAGLALVLGAVGIYGMISFFVGQRTREFGIRMALGAQRRDVLWIVLREGLILALTGITVGILAAIALTRLLGGLLFGVGPTDPLTLGCVAGLFAFVALVACYVPSRRATKVDPMVALRYE